MLRICCCKISMVTAIHHPSKTMPNTVQAWMFPTWRTMQWVRRVCIHQTLWAHSTTVWTQVLKSSTPNLRRPTTSSYLSSKTTSKSTFVEKLLKLAIINNNNISTKEINKAKSAIIPNSTSQMKMLRQDRHNAHLGTTKTRKWTIWITQFNTITISSSTWCSSKTMITNLNIHWARKTLIHLTMEWLPHWLHRILLHRLGDHQTA